MVVAFFLRATTIYSSTELRKRISSLMYTDTKTIIKKKKKLNLTPYFFLIPALVFIVFVYVLPLYKIFHSSFFMERRQQKIFVGLQNYKNIFSIDTTFKISIRNNGILILGVPILVFIALLCAFIIYERVKGWKIFRTVLFLPYILAITVVSIVFLYLYRSDGIINFVLGKIGLGFLQTDWIGSTRTAIFAVLFVIIWHEFGFGMILFLARLMGVNKELFEAAAIDGANWWQRLRHVTIPQLRVILEFYTTICIINVMSWSFNYIFSMTMGGPGNSTSIMEFYIYRTAFMYNLPNYASALSVILFSIVLGLIVIQT